MREGDKDPNHLFEADKVRIRNEAKVRTAMEQPDFAETAFEEWREYRQKRFSRDEKIRQTYLEATDDKLFANAYARAAWMAEGREIAMGRELTKLQQRVGRQRNVNRRQHEALKQANERIKELEGS